MTEALADVAPAIRLCVDVGPTHTGQLAMALESTYAGGGQPFGFPPHVRTALEHLMVDDGLVREQYCAPSEVLMVLRSGALQSDVWLLRGYLKTAFQEASCQVTGTATHEWPLIQRLTVEAYPGLSHPQAVALEVVGAATFPLSLEAARLALGDLSDRPVMLAHTGNRLIFSPHTLNPDELEQALQRLREAIMHPPVYSNTNFVFAHDQRPVPAAAA